MNAYTVTGYNDPFKLNQKEEFFSEVVVAESIPAAIVLIEGIYNKPRITSVEVLQNDIHIQEGR